MKTNGLGGVSGGVVLESAQVGEWSTKGWSLHENPEVSKGVVLHETQRKEMKTNGLGGVSKGVVPARKSKKRR